MAVPQLKCLVAFGTDPLSADPATPAQWTDISSYLDPSGFATERGRRSELDQIQAGTASLVLDNRDRRFEVDYSGSPYYPNVVAGRAIRLIATWNGVDYPLFRGYTQSWTPREDGRHNKVSVSMTDVVGVYFSRVYLGDEVLVNGVWSETLSTPVSLMGTQPGNRKVIFRIAGLSTPFAYVTIRVTGTNGGGVPINETLTITYPAVFASSVNNFRHITMVEQWGYSDPSPTGMRWTVSIDPTFPAEFSGSHIDSLLHTVRWRDIAANHSIGSGISLIQSYAHSGTLLSALVAAAEAENGTIFVDATGKFTFQNRHTRITTPITYTLWNEPLGTSGYTEIPYESITFDWGDQYIYNEVTMQRAGGTAQTQRDSASQQRYFLRTYKKTGVIVASDADMSDSAGWKLYLYKDQKRRISSLVLRGDLTANWSQILGFEIGHKVLVRHTLPSGGTPIEQTCIIERVSVKGTRGNWTVALGLSPGPIGNFLVMDDATLGRLDFNVVAY